MIQAHLNQALNRYSPENRAARCSISFLVLIFLLFFFLFSSGITTSYDMRLVSGSFFLNNCDIYNGNHAIYSITTPFSDQSSGLNHPEHSHSYTSSSSIKFTLHSLDLNQFSYSAVCPDDMRVCASNLCVSKSASCPIESVAFVQFSDSSSYDKYAPINSTHGFGMTRTNPNSVHWVMYMKDIQGIPCLNRDHKDYSYYIQNGATLPDRAQDCEAFNKEEHDRVLTWTEQKYVNDIMFYQPVSLYTVKNIPMEFGAFDHGFDNHHLCDKINLNTFQPFFTYFGSLGSLIFQFIFVLTGYIAIRFKFDARGIIILAILFTLPQILAVNIYVFQMDKFISVAEDIADNTLSLQWRQWALDAVERYNFVYWWVFLSVLQFVFLVLWTLRMWEATTKREQVESEAEQRLNMPGQPRTISAQSFNTRQSE